MCASVIKLSRGFMQDRDRLLALRLCDKLGASCGGAPERTAL